MEDFDQDSRGPYKYFSVSTSNLNDNLFDTLSLLASIQYTYYDRWQDHIRLKCNHLHYYRTSLSCHLLNLQLDWLKSLFDISRTEQRYPKVVLCEGLSITRIILSNTEGSSL